MRPSSENGKVDGMCAHHDGHSQKYAKHSSLSELQLYVCHRYLPDVSAIQILECELHNHPSRINTNLDVTTS